MALLPIRERRQQAFRNRDTLALWPSCRNATLAAPISGGRPFIFHQAYPARRSAAPAKAGKLQYVWST